MTRITAWLCIAFGVLIAPAATPQVSVSSSGLIPKRSTSHAWLTAVRVSATFSPAMIAIPKQNSGTSAAEPRHTTTVFDAAVTVSPAQVNIRAGSTRRVFANVRDGHDLKVVWCVNGIEGGNSTTGTIDAEGTYTAPAVVPANNQIEIEAVSAGNTTLSGKAVVTLLNPEPNIASVDPKNVEYGSQTITINGSGFIPNSLVKMGGVGLPTKFVSGNRLTATATFGPTPGGLVAFTVFNPNPGTDTSAPASVATGPEHPKVSYLAAARFLEQASWGPDAESLAHLQDIGFDAWLAQQFAAPPTLYKSSTSAADNLTEEQSEFFVHATTGADQLRQRVAFALGQIFVVSGLKTGQPRQMVPYQDMLLQDAFGTYSNLLHDVTLSPAMGVYLDMVNDDKGNRLLGTSPNENYARELMQLFSIGTVGLNPDGSETGRVTYDQGTITDMARALTGWTYPGKAITNGHNPEDYEGPMVAVEANHDQGKKIVVGGAVLPAGQSAEQDLKDVLYALSTHPNAAPFISLRLIQHLVTSDPSPAYLRRVSEAFTASGGDLKTVVKQILMDPEARQGDDPRITIAINSGHWREPVLAIIAVMKSLQASVRADNRLERFPASLGQRVFYPGSVFNDYSPLYRTSNGLLAPEFELLSSGTALMRANVVRNLVEKGLNGDAQFDFSPFVTLAGSPSDLVEAVDHALLYGRLPAALKPEIVAAVSATHDYNLRARHAIYLVASSALYQVQH
jgi:uncharacterized protein (DUF1800 family)